MRQRRRCLGLTLETRSTHRVVGELRADGFQRDLTGQSRVVGQVDDAHATFAEQATDLVVPEALANQRSRRRPPPSASAFTAGCSMKVSARSCEESSGEHFPDDRRAAASRLPDKRVALGQVGARARDGTGR